VVESRLGKIAARTISQLERSEAILVAGANPTDSSPVLGYAIKRAVRQRGASLVVLDPMRIDLVPFSSAWLSGAPRKDGVILDALASGLLERGARPADGMEGWEAYAERLSRMDRATVCRESGVDPSSLERAVDALAGKRIAFVVGRGILTQPHSAAAMRALENLALLTDSLEGEARGFFFLSGENNGEGALDMGASPGFLPGRLRVQDAASRQYWERIWGVRISPDPGLNRARALEEMEKGNLKALFVMGENPLRELPRPERTRSAMEKLDLLVVQDILRTETARMAHAVLPGAAFSEKEGSFTNLEGRIQGFEAAVSPPGRAMADWRILAAIYDGLAPSPGRYESIEDVQREIRDHVPGYKAMETRPGGKGTPRYRCETDSREGREKPVFREAGPPPDGFGDPKEYPFVAVLGSVRSHVGSGTRTSRSRRLGEFRETGDLEMNPEDCRRMDVHPGEAVRVVSRHGAVERNVRASRRVRPGFVFVPKGAKGNRAVDLVDLLKNGNIPSACRVRIEKAGNGRRP
jgi:formate dehydrogenase alpha subunit